MSRALKIALFSALALPVVIVDASYATGETGKAFVFYCLFSVTRSSTLYVSGLTYAAIALVWLGSYLPRRRAMGGGKVLRILAINLYVGLGILIAVEGLSTVGLALLAVNESLRDSTDLERPFTDPYTGQPTGRLKLNSPFYIERYRPDSIATFYFDQPADGQQKALYTDRQGFIHNGDPSRDNSRPVEGGKR